MNRSLIKQKGISLIETILAIAIIAVAVAYMTNKHFTDKEILIDRAMGQYMNSTAEGLQKYITANQDAILSGTIPAADGSCSAGVCTISTGTASSLNLYLPDGMLQKSPWYRSSAEGKMTVMVRVAGTVPYQVIQGFVFAVPVTDRYTDETDQETHLSAVVSAGGLNVGAVYPDPPSGYPSGSILGDNGGWSTNLNTIYKSTLPITTLVSRTGDGLPQEDDFLRLDGTNAMTGSLNMGGTKTSASDIDNINNIASTGIANAPNVQFAQTKVTGDIDVGAGDDYLSGVNFVQSGGTDLGSIRADQAAGGTKIIGPYFILGGKHVSAQETMGGVANIWYVPNDYTDTSYHLTTQNWQQWGSLSVNMTNLGNTPATDGDVFSLGTVRTSDLHVGGTDGTLDASYGDPTRVRIYGTASNTIGSTSTGQGVMTINKGMTVTNGVTNVTGNTLIETTFTATNNISVDELNSSTWASNPVDVTLLAPSSKTWQFNGAMYTKNIKFEPNNAYAIGNSCSPNGAAGADKIGALVYCKGGVWVAGWK